VNVLGGVYCNFSNVEAARKLLSTNMTGDSSSGTYHEFAIYRNNFSTDGR